MFFGLSKIFWALVQPLNALCLLAIVGLLVCLRWPRAGQGMMNAALILILIFGVFPVGPWALTWLERQYPTPQTTPTKIEGIIVLGGAFESYLTAQTGHVVANGQVDRLFCFIELAKLHPEAKLVFSGGSGDILNPEALETDDAKAFFRLIGLYDREIIYESQSRNTYENAVYTKDIIKPRKGSEWILVTSAYHMPRSVGIFEKVGWPIIPYQCDPRTDGSYNLSYRFPSITGNFSALNIAVKEILGLIVYYTTGKSAFILPPPPIPSQP
jgi:uncharacterized SAM-binding protein YcdF (DUF218 family)